MESTGQSDDFAQTFLHFSIKRDMVLYVQINEVEYPLSVLIVVLHISRFFQRRKIECFQFAYVRDSIRDFLRHGPAISVILELIILVDSDSLLNTPPTQGPNGQASEPRRSKAF